MASQRRAVWRFAGLVCGLGALAGVVLVVQPDTAALVAAVDRYDRLAPFLAVVGSAVLAAALVPRAVLATAGGFLFGPVLGSGYVLLGVTGGALAAFGLARLLGREFVAGRLGPRLTRLDERLTRGGFATVVMVRLLPVIPFGVASYGFGATGVRPVVFGLGTVLGAAPTTIAYATVGAGLARVPGGPMSGLSWTTVLALSGVTVVALLGAVVLRRLAAGFSR